MYTVSHAKQAECYPGRHLEADVSQSRVKEDFTKLWPKERFPQFRVVSFEFVWMPPGYYNESVIKSSNYVFRQFIPFLVKEYEVEAVWVPVFPSTSAALCDARDELVQCGLKNWVAVTDPFFCPLYRATIMTQTDFNLNQRVSVKDAATELEKQDRDVPFILLTRDTAVAERMIPAWRLMACPDEGYVKEQVVVRPLRTSKVAARVKMVEGSQEKRAARGKERRQSRPKRTRATSGSKKTKKSRRRVVESDEEEEEEEEGEKQAEIDDSDDEPVVKVGRGGKRSGRR